MIGWQVWATLALGWAVAHAPAAEVRRFAIGERLDYNTHAGPGVNGRAHMWVDGPVEIQGVSAIALHSSFTARLGFLRVTDNSTSWIDATRMVSLRFLKEERHLLARYDEDVALNPALRQWSAVDGRKGTSATDEPLDELSFIYALRGFELPPDSSVVLTRHFDSERNPTTLRLVSRGSLTTPAGTFSTLDIEMRVHDARRYRGEGVIRISLSDDSCRRPVRIESTIPGAGTIVMTLTAAEPVLTACLPRLAASAPD